MKTITFEYEGKKYTLGFNRVTVAKMEKKGFNVAKAEDNPISTMLTLWKGSFLLNHPDTDQQIIDDIFDGIENKTDLYNQLVEMYGDTLNSLLSSKNEIKWTIS